MKRTIVTCDNCGAEVSGDGRNVRVPGRTLDACTACVEGTARDLTAIPFDEWPRLVRRDDVRHYLEQEDREAMLATERIAQLEGDLARLRRRNGGRETDLAADLLNIATHRPAADVVRDVEALQRRARAS